MKLQEFEEKVRRLVELRRKRDQLDEEIRQLNEEITPVIKAMGGKVEVGMFEARLVERIIPSYSKIVEALEQRHPELQDEIKTLRNNHFTITQYVSVKAKVVVE